LRQFVSNGIPHNCEVNSIEIVPQSVPHASDFHPGVPGHQRLRLWAKAVNGFANSFETPLYSVTDESVSLETFVVQSGVYPSMRSAFVAT
jgi:hypothetical protein